MLVVPNCASFCEILKWFLVLHQIAEVSTTQEKVDFFKRKRLLFQSSKSLKYFSSLKYFLAKMRKL